MKPNHNPQGPQSGYPVDLSSHRLQEMALQEALQKKRQQTFYVWPKPSLRLHQPERLHHDESLPLRLNVVEHPTKSLLEEFGVLEKPTETDRDTDRMK